MTWARQVSALVLLIVIRCVGRAPQWVQVNTPRLNVTVLLGYSPEPKPEEYLKQDFNANTVRWTQPLERTDMIGCMRARSPLATSRIVLSSGV